MINKVFVTNVCPSGKFFDCYPLASFEDKRHLSAGQSKRVTKVVLLFRPVYSLIKMDQGFMLGC